MKITVLALVLLSSPAICLGYLPADFDYSGMVDFNDFATFSSQWLQENSEMNYGSGGAATFFVASYDAPVHVKSRADYVCDGVDDHIEIQAAIDKIGQESPTWGGVVVLSSGKFNCSASIDLNCTNGDGTYISLWGLGNGIIGTYLEWLEGSNCDGIVYHAGPGCIGDFSLRCMRLKNSNDGDYWTVNITAEEDTNIYDCLFEDVFVIGGGDSSDHSHGGMHVQKDWASHFVRCTFEVSRGVGLQMDRVIGGMFTDCFFAGNRSYGLKVTSGIHLSMVNCAAQKNGTFSDDLFSADGMYMGADYSLLTNIYLFGNAGWGVKMTGPWSALTNCFAYDNGKGASSDPSGGIFIGETNITAVNCQARRNLDNGNTKCFGFFVDASGTSLIGCRSLENSNGLYVAEGNEDVYLDVRFEDNLFDDYVQGDGAHSVFARRNHKTAVSSVSCEVDNVDNGTIYIADTTNNDVTFALPGATVGLEFEFFFSNGVNQLQIDPYGSEELYEDNSSHGTGKYIYADEVGESIKLKCIYPGRWEMVDKIGTWAAEP